MIQQGTWRGAGAVIVLCCLAAGCGSFGTRPGPAAEQQRRIAQALHRARVDLEEGVAELEQRSAALDAAGVTALLAEVARRDTLYRKLVHLRREIGTGFPSEITGQVDLRSRPPRLDIPAIPLVEPFMDGRHWMLQGYLIHRFGSTAHVLIVPAGFVTDLASVPDIAEALLPRSGEYSNAAIIHDYLYWTQSCTREQADNLMSIAMKEARVATWKDLLIHSAVRLGGQRAWNANSERRASGFIRTVDSSWDRSPSATDWSTLQASLQETKSRSGAEPRVSPQVCAVGNSLREQ